MKWDIENQKLVASFLNRLSGVYDKATKQVVGLGYSVTNYKSDKPFSFSDFPVTNKKADNLFSQMAYEVKSLINGGTEAAWLQSNTANDGLVDKYFAKSGLSKEQLSKYYDRNLNALGAYQNRIDSGVQLSDRVWKYTNQFKNEIELAVSVGIGEGRSADQLSRDIRGYLQDPDKLFHKVKNQYGQLVLSKNAKAYHPGQGVYRSSYKNAVRLARTEINMAFHQADNERWNSLDFISGYKVVMSNQHPEYDICDELHGDYPKTFTFWGWHVQCMCHTVPIMSSDKEFASQTAKLLKGEDITGYVPSNTITELPPNFKQWAVDNQERIQTAKSMPYFIDKNFAGTNVAEWFKKAEKTAAIVEKAPVLSAKELEKLEWKKDEIVYAKKKLSEADKFGVAGANYDALLAAIENESLTYAQIAGKSSKLVQEIKAAKAAAADPFSEAALLKKYSKTEVESLFKAYDNFYATKVNHLHLSDKISKVEYEINWLKTNGKYSTSGVFREMLERDLVAMKANKDVLFLVQEAKEFTFLHISIADKTVSKALQNLKKLSETSGVNSAALSAEFEKAKKVVESYYKANIKSVSPLDLSFFEKEDKFSLTKLYTAAEKERIKKLRIEYKQAIINANGNVRDYGAREAQERLASAIHDISFNHVKKQTPFRNIGIELHDSPGKQTYKYITDKQAEKSYISYIGRNKKWGDYYSSGGHLGGVYNGRESAQIAYRDRVNNAGGNVMHEQSILGRYFGGSGFFNNYISGNDFSYVMARKELKDTLHEYVEAWSYASNKLPRYNGYTYRGMGFSQDVLSEFKSCFKDKKPFTHRYGMSTSLNPEIADYFGTGFTLKVYGRSGVYGGDFSVFASEVEVLYRPGSKFEIIDMYQETTNNGIAKKGNWTVILKEILE